MAKRQEFGSKILANKHAVGRFVWHAFGCRSATVPSERSSVARHSKIGSRHSVLCADCLVYLARGATVNSLRPVMVISF